MWCMWEYWRKVGIECVLVEKVSEMVILQQRNTTACLEFFESVLRMKADMVLEEAVV